MQRSVTSTVKSVNSVLNSDSESLIQIEKAKTLFCQMMITELIIHQDMWTTLSLELQQCQHKGSIHLRFFVKIQVRIFGLDLVKLIYQLIQLQMLGFLSVRIESFERKMATRMTMEEDELFKKMIFLNVFLIEIMELFDLSLIKKILELHVKKTNLKT